MADGREIKNRFFWPQLSSRLPDSSKILRGKAVLHMNFGNETDIPARSTERIFCFPHAVWAAASGGFRIVSDTFV